MKPKSIKFAAMTIHEANKRLLFDLYAHYDNCEAANIADLVMENITGWKRIDRVVNKDVKMSVVMEQQLEKYAAELSAKKPVQYVLHEAWFAGMKLYVDEHVLIPRPETEELVDWLKNEVKKNAVILDIGTGSGCIAVAVKKLIPGASVLALDVSEGALAVAKKNAIENDADVQMLLGDVLDEEHWSRLPSFDVIVSNPPYIPSLEKNVMQENVTKFEPHLALFVPDDDPLKFYRAIARFAEKKLLPGGKIFVELHENYAEQVKNLFTSFEVEVKTDLQGKKRMLKALG